MVSRALLVITAVTVQGLTQAEAARQLGLSPSRVSRIMSRWRREGDAGVQPRSRRPKTSPTATPSSTIALIAQLRQDLGSRGLDHGPATIGWHLQQHHGITVSRATIARILHRTGLVVPAPRKRPRSSYIRFEAAMPNQCWQADFTHWTLADGTGIEVLTFLDDCTRYAISVTAHPTVTAPIVLTTFRNAVDIHGAPAETLTDNGMVFTVRLAGFGRRGGRNAFEHELERLGITQKNGAPSHPQTQGKVERFQQTLKKWLTAQPRAATLTDLQELLNTFVTDYNQHRPHRSLPHHATPAARYQTLPKASPRTSPTEPHERIRRDRVDTTGTITIRYDGKLRHIPVGRTHARSRVLAIIHGADVTIINAITGELLRQLTIDPNRDYQPLRNAKSRT